MCYLGALFRNKAAMFKTVSGLSISPCDGRDTTPGHLSFSLRVANQGLSPAAPWASISSSLINQLGKNGSKPRNRAENATGIDFPVEFCHTSGQTQCPQLAGLGVRAKRLLGLKNINVYACGVYVDATAARKVLGPKFRGLPVSDLATSQALMDEVAQSGTIEKTLRLVIAYPHLKRAQFVEALEERLAPLMKQVGEGAALGAFRAQFDGCGFARGTEIAFTHTGGALVTKVGGVCVGRLSSPALARALFSVYLGASPPCPAAKDTLAHTLAEALAGPQ